ncbi:MAG: acyl transferase [Chitinophagales bacterium]
MREDFQDKIFQIRENEFPEFALELFQFQFENNPIYREYAKNLGKVPDKIKEISAIPFLPVDFFKTHSIQTTSFEPSLIFETSGTVRQSPGRHLVKDVTLYRNSFVKGFEKFYGPVTDWTIIGLLPSYLERKGSSLVFMVEELIKESAHEKSGFYLNEFEHLFNTLQDLEKNKERTLLIGVSFALLDFADQFPMPLDHTIMMETGGMKGRRKEITRAALHDHLREKFSLVRIHSEYGMTELLSQAYARADGLFESVPWMRVLVRHEDDPLLISEHGAGLVNIIDLANIHSCAFIATDDIGKIYPDKKFEILGRMDGSVLRGCSLMVV